MASERTMRTRSSCRCSQKLILSGGVTGRAMVLKREKGPASGKRPAGEGLAGLLLVLVGGRGDDVFLHGVRQFAAGLLELLDALAQALAHVRAPWRVRMSFRV